MRDDESTKSHREKKTIKANVEAVEATNVSKCHNVRLESLTRNGPMDFLHLLTVAGQLLVPCLSCSLQMLAGMGHSWSFKISLKCHNDVSQNSAPMSVFIK